jgi:hypothetical protein
MLPGALSDTALKELRFFAGLRFAATLGAKASVASAKIAPAQLIDPRIAFIAPDSP